MCGRYTLIRLADFTDMFPWVRLPDSPPPERYNIAPTQPIAVIPNNGKDKIEFFHWGLIPSWAKDKSIGNRTINARAETLAEKPMFKTALKRRRCLVLADGFYEWQKSPDGKTKRPMYIRMKNHKPFAFAGLWETWHDREGGGGEIPSCTIITTTPNSLVRSIHDRMPVIVKPEHYKDWLAPTEKQAEELKPILSPYPENEMEAYPVSRMVNSPANESAKCIDPDADVPAADPVPAPAPLVQPRSKKSKPAEPEAGLFG